jgi:hypothetical protein
MQPLLTCAACVQDIRRAQQQYHGRNSSSQKTTQINTKDWGASLPSVSPAPSPSPAPSVLSAPAAPQVVRKIYAGLVSCECERVFNSAKRLIPPERVNLGDDIIEVLECLKA